MSSHNDAFLGQDQADDGLEAAAELTVPLADVPLASGVPALKASTRQRQGSFRRWAVLAAAGLVVLALLGGGTVSVLVLNPAATVTITPKSSDLKQTFTLTGVTGTPNASKQQVGARILSVTTPAQTKTVPATGQGTIPGTHAHGTASVYNYDSTNPLTLAAGTTYPNNYSCRPASITIVLDATVSLPAAPPGYHSTTDNVPFHILQVGPVPSPPDPNCAPDNLFYIGGSQTCPNILPYDYCTLINGYDDWADGTNPQTVTAVAQSDIDTAAQSLIQANQPNAGQVMQGQLHPGEQLAGMPQCSPNTSADHQAGDAADQVTVTVTFTCSGEAYDHAGALALAASLLQEQTASTPGSGYALVGQLKTTLLSATPDAQGAVQILVQAEGIWAAQFSVAEMQALAKLIAGKSQQDAQQLLTTQPGVAQASITLAGGIGQTLPADPAKITLVVRTISGFQRVLLRKQPGKEARTMSSNMSELPGQVQVDDRLEKPACAAGWERRSKLALLGLLIGLVVAGLGGCGTTQQPTVNAQPIPANITEFPLPNRSFPHMITPGPDGNLWFTESAPSGGKIGRITPAGTITEFPLPTPDSLPSYGITAGPDGNLWFTEEHMSSDHDAIGRITPSGVITEFLVPTPRSIVEGITAGPDGNLWFTEFGRNQIGQITLQGAITEFPLPAANSQPVEITTGPDGNLWFTEQGGNQIGRITPTGVVTEFPLKKANSNPAGIIAGPDGNLWFTETSSDNPSENTNQIGRITPGGMIKEFLVPTTNSGPNGITVGPDRNLWFTEYNSNQIGRITPVGTFTEFSLKTANSDPGGITTGPDGDLWFTEAGGKIGKLSSGR